MFGVALDKLKTGVKPVTNVLSSIKAGITGISVETQKDISIVDDFSKALNAGIKLSKAWATTMSGASEETQKLVRQQLSSTKVAGNQIKTIQNQTKALKDTTNKLKEGSTATKAMAAGIKALNVAANMFVSALVSTAISMGISFIISQIMGVVNAEKEAIQKAQEAADAFKSQIDTLKSLRQEYLDIVDSTDTVWIQLRLPKCYTLFMQTRRSCSL